MTAENSKPEDSAAAAPTAGSLRRDIAEGLFYVHARLSENTKANLEASSFLYGLVELLSEKGIISIDDLDKRKEAVAERLIRKNKDKGVGVLMQDPEEDKYTFKDVARIDCASCVHQCRAACCRLPFALSKQDLNEGIVHWDFGEPYIIAQEKDGYCSHLDQSCSCCAIWQHRPVPCRAYDCRKDDKIWLDFEKQIINPAIRDSQWPRNVKPETNKSKSP